MRLSSPAFAANSPIPVRFTADGADVSPPLAWSGAPQRAQSFALICSDPEAPAGTWFHWGIFDIPAGTTSLPENFAGHNGHARVALNDFLGRDYRGPAPPRGHGRHHYHFTLYALDTARLELPNGIGCHELESEAETHAIATAELVAVYSR